MGVFALGVIPLFAALAGAQPLPSDPAALRLERVEQGFEDISPLARSLQWYEPEYRQPSGYDTVYRVPGADGLLMRQNGAVQAIFDRSEYLPTRFGDQALVPAGTVFAIGEPSAELLESLSGRVAATRSLARPAGPLADPRATASTLRVSNRIPSERAAEVVRPIHAAAVSGLPEPAPSLWTNDHLRQRRVASLMRSLAPTQDSSPNR